MKVYYGTSRIVVIVGKIKIKIARIFLFKFLKYTFFLLLKHRKLWSSVIYFDIDCSGTPQFYLLKGVRDNWREFCFYLKTRHPFILPTYFSFFGIVNVCGVGEECKNDFFYIWRELNKITKDVQNDLHHFGQDKNFVVYKNKFCMADYSGEEVQKIIISYGKEIQGKITALL